jgi:hypothetical protein
MIRNAIHESPPIPGPLLRDSRNEDIKRANQIARFQHAISHIHYEAANVVHLVRLGTQLTHLCKQILLRNGLPDDILSAIYDYAYDCFDAYRVTRLPPRIFSCTIHHLIRTELVEDVPISLDIGKQFDSLLLERERYNYTFDEFRDTLLQCKCVTPTNWHQLTQDAALWYLQGTYATRWLR